MKDLIKILDEVVMKQLFDKDKYIIAVSKAKNILEKLDEGKIRNRLDSLDIEVEKLNHDIFITNKGRAKSLTIWLGGGE